eukprot:2954023-Pyramimonas_sp.AAC.1
MAVQSPSYVDGSLTRQRSKQRQLTGESRGHRGRGITTAQNTSPGHTAWGTACPPPQLSFSCPGAGGGPRGARPRAGSYACAHCQSRRPAGRPDDRWSARKCART